MTAWMMAYSCPSMTTRPSRFVRVCVPSRKDWRMTPRPRGGMFGEMRGRLRDVPTLLMLALRMPDSWRARSSWKTRRSSLPRRACPQAVLRHLTTPRCGEWLDLVIAAAF